MIELRYSMPSYLLINYEYPPLGGGAATACKNLALALKRKGNRVVVLTSAYERLRGESDEDGVVVIRIPALRRSVHRSSLFQMAAYLVSACHHVVGAADCYEVDRVIAFFSIPGGIVARWLQLRRSTPYIISVRGGDVPGTEPKLSGFYRLLTRLRRHILRHAREIIAPSIGLKQLSEAADPVSVRVIPNGVDPTLFAPPADQRHLPLTLLFAGRLHWQKNVSALLSILDVVRLRFGLPAIARIIGDGPERLHLEKLSARMKLENAITFEGWLSRAEIASAYRQAFLLVNLSRYEGMSNVVLEALASGLPIIASNIPGNTELIEDQTTGFLFNLDEDPVKIAKQIVDLFGNPERRIAMGKAARESVVTRYTWDQAAAMYEEAWEKGGR
jgi:glycosyltransferase involved in cell wall biosynthesis